MLGLFDWYLIHNVEKQVGVGFDNVFSRNRGYHCIIEMKPLKQEQEKKSQHKNQERKKKKEVGYTHHQNWISSYRYNALY